MNKTPDKTDIDLLEYWRIVLKRRWVLITAVAVLLVLTTVRTFTTTPLYRATASILIEEPSSSMLNIQDLMNRGSYYGGYDYLGAYFNTQLRLITSRSLAEQVAKRMNLPARPELQDTGRRGFNPLASVRNLLSLSWLTPHRVPAGEETARPQAPLSPFAEHAFTVLGGLSVEPVEETRLVYVSYTSPHPQLAADIVNTLVEEFITYSVETRYEATKQASEFLTEQIAQLREDLGAKERELQRYGEDKDLLFLSDQESSVVNKFANVNQAYTDAQIGRYEKEARWRELRSLNVDALPQYIENPLIQGLKTSYLQTKSEYEEKGRTYRPEHPEMVRVKARMDGQRTELSTEIGKAVDAAASEYRAALKNEESLRGMLENQRTDVVRTNNSAILYKSLSIEVESMRSMLSNLEAQQNETLVSARLGGLRTSNIKIVDRALVPGGPFSPDIQRSLLMALLLGLFGGVGLIFVIEYLDNTVKGPEDAEKLTGLPSLGIIPYLSPDGLKKNGQGGRAGYTYGAAAAVPDEMPPEISEIELINHLYPKFSIAEDYRTIRTSILFSHADEMPKSICFTSTVPQEGKTATIANLAVSFAQLESRILLIDADLRKPRLHKVFKSRNLIGLSSYLTGRVSLEDAIQKTGVDHVWLMSSGPHPPNPAELLNSRRMRELLEQAKERFDTVLIDTPPVLAVIDPVIVGSLADCTVFVIRSGKTTRKPMVKAIAEMRRGKAKIIGVVFNEVRIGRQGAAVPYYHYYQYEYAAAAETERSVRKDRDAFEIGGRRPAG